MSILKYVKEYQDFNNIIIGGDMNQDITLSEVQAFYTQLRVKDIYQYFNYIEDKELDRIYKN